MQVLARDAVQRAAAGDYAGAEPLLAEVVAARPNSGQALHLLGQARLKLGRFAEAREPLERAAKLHPDDPAIAHKRGHALEALRRFDEAERAYDAALASDHRLLPSLIA